jgi:radical SAM protein with 4Fe4S-binding SPASM domain
VWSARNALSAVSAVERFVAPDALAVVEVEGEIVRIRRVNGTTIDARGALGSELLALIDSGNMGPLLTCMADAPQLGGNLKDLAGIGRKPLTPTTALELSGWDLLFVEVVGRCNERCVHCYADAAPEVESELSLETCLAIVDAGAALGFARVQFTGGDPLLCPFLPELVERASGAGLATEIYTNGLLLSQKLLDRLAPHKPTLAFSFYSHDAAVHDAITQTANSHALTTRAIDRAVAAGFAVRVSIIVMEQNAHDLAATCDYLRAHGVTELAFAPTRTVGRGKSFTGTIDYSLTGQLRSAHGGSTVQEQGKLAVASDGSVYPCIFNRSTPLGNVNHERLEQIVKAPAMRRSLLGSDEHDIERLQCVGCRLTATALRACSRAIQ